MSVAPLSTLRVTSQTTLEDLQAFQERIGKDDAKIRGSKNKDGSITLKAVDRDSSFLSKMFGVSKKRRDNARSALTMVMTNSGAIDRKPMGSLNSLINADRKHSPKSAMLREILAFVQANNVDPNQKVSETPIKKEKQLDSVLSRTFPTLEAKGLDKTRMENSLKLARDLSRDQPLSDTRVQQFVDQIKTDLYTQLTRNGPLSLNERSMLGIDDIEGYVMEAVSRVLPQPQNENVTAAVEKIAKGVADQLSEQLLGTKQINADSFKIGNETFNRVAVLGQGGFGRAELYRSATTGREVVLKVPGEIDRDAPPDVAVKAKFDFKAEINMHSKIMDSADRTYPHLLSFEGAVRLPNGLFATVTEACTSGDMASMMRNIDAAVRNGSLTAEQAMACKLTLMRDMVDGQSILFNRGFSHRDVKFENVFIDGKGNGKVADFGETAFGRTFNLWTEKIIENPTYLAPENLIARNKIERFQHKVVEMQFAHMKAKVETYNALVGPGGAFEKLNLPQFQTDKFDPAPEDTPTFELGRWRGQASREMQRFENALAQKGELGEALRLVINDMTQGEAQRLQDAVDTLKAQIPIQTMISGGPSDVFSFGTSLLKMFVRPGQSINSLDEIQSENQMTRYFNEGQVDGNNGLPQAPLPRPLEPGSFLMPNYVSPHPNGTVTGDQELDDLLNLVLQRNPDDRPTFAELLQSPVFTRLGVGDKATRDVIAALGTRPPQTVEEIQELAIEMAV